MNSNRSNFEGKNPDEPEEYIDYEDMFDWEEYPDDELIKAKPRLNFAIKLLALITLISFLALSYPWLKHLVDGSIIFIQQDQALNKDSIVITAKPSVVSIESNTTSPPSRKGTGFVITEEKLIVTNAHIVNNAKSIEITYSDGTKEFSNNYEIIGENDIAIIYTNEREVPHLSLETENPADIGDIVTIIGNPLGYNKIAQRGKVENYYDINNNSIPALIIDIPIKPGNSGSPVLNQEGKVVGIIFASLNYTENDIEKTQALAIPIHVIDAFFK